MNRRDFRKSDKGVGCFILCLCLFFTSVISYAGSIKDVRQNIERVRSIEPPFQFALIGDSRDGDRVYAQLLQRIAERRPSFMIHLGDMISKPSEKAWHSFFERSQSIDAPFFPVVGNHDVGDNRRGQEIYHKQFVLPEEKHHYYTFWAGGVLFVVLDSENGKGKIGKEQGSWLKDILSNSREAFKLILIHRPLFLPIDSLKIGRGMDRHIFERDDLHRLFVRKNVKAVFQGDDHRYDRREKDHILYLISGGGGAPLFAMKERGGYYHYVWISVGEGKMQGEVVDVEGRIRDRFMVE